MAAKEKGEKRSGVGLNAHAVTAALDDDGFGVVEQSVKQSRGEGAVVIEDPGPLLEGAIRCNGY